MCCPHIATASSATSGIRNLARRLHRACLLPNTTVQRQTASTYIQRLTGRFESETFPLCVLADVVKACQWKFAELKLLLLANNLKERNQWSNLSNQVDEMGGTCSRHGTDQLRAYTSSTGEPAEKTYMWMAT